MGKTRNEILENACYCLKSAIDGLENNLDAKHYSEALEYANKIMRDCFDVFKQE